MKLNLTPDDLLDIYSLFKTCKEYNDKTELRIRDGKIEVYFPKVPRDSGFHKCGEGWMESQYSENGDGGYGYFNSLYELKYAHDLLDEQERLDYIELMREIQND